MKTSTAYSISDTRELKDLSVQLLAFTGTCRIIAFFGEMGAGKTTFIREVCHSLRVTENVSSPTFSLVNEYVDGQGTPIYHFDFYRINSEKEAIDIGCEEYFYSGRFCLIEWPEKILNLLPHPHVRVEIEADHSKRTFTFSHD